MKQETNKYTKEQLDFLRAGYLTMSRRELTQAFNARFNMAKTQRAIVSTIKNHNITSGRTGYFKRSHQPWNTGTKGLTTQNITTYKKGNVPINRKSLGAERVDKRNNFILVKIAERDPYTGFSTRYKHKHVYIWEQANGKVTKGMVIAFKDGNTLNCKLSNLMLLSRSELLRLNNYGYKNQPAELKPSILALGKLKDKIGKLEHSQQR